MILQSERGKKLKLITSKSLIVFEVAYETEFLLLFHQGFFFLPE